jgi:hypothetical protein
MLPMQTKMTLTSDTSSDGDRGLPLRQDAAPPGPRMLDDLQKQMSGGFQDIENIVLSG